MLKQPSAISHQPSAKKGIFLAALSGILLILSFPLANIEFLAWFGFVPLFFAIRNKSKLSAFILAYFAGIIFWSGTIYWLIHVSLLGMVLLVLYLALYFGLFGLLILAFSRPLFFRQAQDTSPKDTEWPLDSSHSLRVVPSDVKGRSRSAAIRYFFGRLRTLPRRIYPERSQRTLSGPLTRLTHSGLSPATLRDEVELPLNVIRLLFIPSVWVILEYLRSHLLTGFAWTLLGYSQYLNLGIIQIADITGVWGVSFLVMLVNVTIYNFLPRFRLLFFRLAIKLGAGSCFAGTVYRLPSYAIRIIIMMLVILAAVLGYGYYSFRLPPTTHNLPLRISVIQGNIPQELKWDINARDFIIDKYLGLTKEAIKDKPDLIIWPEAALPVILQEDPIYYEMVSDFVKKNYIPLLLGAVTLRDNLCSHAKDSGVDVYYNSALMISGEGELLNRYDKLHLVPFGEYIPLKKILGFLQTIVPIGDITAGKEYSIFQIPDSKSLFWRQAGQMQNKFAVLICFEDIFPELSREFVKRGARFLVNITNDAWYKKTSASYQHFQASVFRAVENRVFLVRSANTGISGFISPKGEIISLVGEQFDKKDPSALRPQDDPSLLEKNSLRGQIFIDGYKTEEIIIPKRQLSFYTRYGDVFVLLCVFIVLCGIGIIMR